MPPAPSPKLLVLHAMHSEGEGGAKRQETLIPSLIQILKDGQFKQHGISLLVETKMPDKTRIDGLITTTTPGSMLFIILNAVVDRSIDTPLGPVKISYTSNAVSHAQIIHETIAGSLLQASEDESLALGIPTLRIEFPFSYYYPTFALPYLLVDVISSAACKLLAPEEGPKSPS